MIKKNCDGQIGRMKICLDIISRNIFNGFFRPRLQFGPKKHFLFSIFLREAKLILRNGKSPPFKMWIFLVQIIRLLKTLQNYFQKWRCALFVHYNFYITGPFL